MPPQPNAFYPQQPAMGMAPGRPMGPGIAAMGDKFKEMRIMELIQNPALELMRDPMLAHYIPRGRIPYGWSLPDRGKDVLLYSLHRKQMAGTLSPEGHELLHLVGDIPTGPRY